MNFLKDIDVILYGTAAVLQTAAFLVAWKSDFVRKRRGARKLISAAAILSGSLYLFSFLLRKMAWTGGSSGTLMTFASSVIPAWALLMSVPSAAYLISRLLFRVRPSHSAGRRRFLQTAQGALLAVPVGVVGYGTFIERYNFELNEVDLPIPGLPKDLEGLRLVQLTDIHLSPYLSAKELAHCVGMANETKAHIALVTGDLISFEEDPLDDCLDQLAKLKSEAGTFGCMGNHEIYAGSEDYTQRRGAELGMRFLRQQHTGLRFGDATLNLAGVDYQRRERPYLVGSEKLVAPDATNLLLSHNPDVFPVAAKKGFQGTISGHTHGGQVRFELLRQDLTVARFITPYVHGLYQTDESAIFVSRGIGTIGLPTRFGAPPEVSLIRLRRS